MENSQESHSHKSSVIPSPVSWNPLPNGGFSSVYISTSMGFSLNSLVHPIDCRIAESESSDW